MIKRCYRLPNPPDIKKFNNSLSILTLLPGQTLYWIQIFTISQLHTYQFCFPPRLSRPALHYLHHTLAHGGKVRIVWVGHKIWKNLPLKRSIFQTFWKVHCVTKSLFFELETPNFGSSYIFSSPLKLQGQILPNLTFWTQKWYGIFH